MGCPLYLVPTQGRGDKGELYYPSHSHPRGQAKKKKELADKLRKVKR
jgi:hypothetical protein